MKADRHAETARRFNIKDKCERLEADLLAIPGVADVEFDLDGFYDHLQQVIFLVGYSHIDPRREDYFTARRKMLARIAKVAQTHGLAPSGDMVEDYGAHYYFVWNCDSSWDVQAQHQGGMPREGS